MLQGLILYFVFLLILAVGVTVFKFARHYRKRTAEARMQTELRRLSARIIGLLENGKYAELDNYIREYPRNVNIQYLRTVLICTENFKHLLPGRRELRDDFDNLTMKLKTETFKAIAGGGH